MTNEQIDPRFAEALEQWCAMQAAGQADSEEGYEVWEAVWSYAPEWFRTQARSVLSGLVPDPAGYDADGNPVYRLADVAEKLGTTEQAMLESGPHVATTIPPVHLIH
jgi:hypothetical protein